MPIKLRGGAEAAFVISVGDMLNYQFSITVYGAGRASWCVASYRECNGVGGRAELVLPNGEWRTLLHLVERCGFWSLPEDGGHIVAPTVVDGGEWLTVQGRDGARSHRVVRYVWWEPGLNGVLAFGQRVSGLYVRDPEFGWRRPRAGP